MQICLLQLTKILYYSFALKVITPQANLSPAFPVFKLSSSPPLPKSSLSECTTTALPTTLLSPLKSTRLATILNLAYRDTDKDLILPVLNKISNT